MDSKGRKVYRKRSADSGSPVPGSQFGGSDPRSTPSPPPSHPQSPARVTTPSTASLTSRSLWVPKSRPSPSPAGSVPCPKEELATKASVASQSVWVGSVPCPMEELATKASVASQSSGIASSGGSPPVAASLTWRSGGSPPAPAPAPAPASVTSRSSGSPPVAASLTWRSGGSPPAPAPAPASVTSPSSGSPPVAKSVPVSPTPQKPSQAKWIPISPTPPCGIKLPKPSQHDAGAAKLQLASFLQKTTLPKGGESVVIIDFMDLLYEDKELALSMCIGDPSWTEARLNEAGMELLGAKIHIKGLPERVYDAKELLNGGQLTKMVDLFHGDKAQAVKVAVFRGRYLCRLIVWALLDCHSKGESYLGQLTIDNLVFVQKDDELHAVIAKFPSVKIGAVAQEKALDVNSIWSILEPFLDVDGSLPLYFNPLKKILLAATENELRCHWFPEFLRYFPAFAASMARCDLILLLFLAVRYFNLSNDNDFRYCLNRKPFLHDWRITAKADRILRKTYSYNQSSLKVLFINPQHVLVTKERHQEEGILSILQQEVEGNHEQQEEGILSKLQQDPLMAANKKELQQEVEGNLEQQVEILSKLQQELPMAATKKGVQEPEVLEGETVAFVNPRQVTVLKQDQDMETEPEDDYEDTLKDLLALNRHSLTHTGDHSKLKKIHDAELHNAKAFEDFLPVMIKEILSVGVKNSELEGIWTSYQAAIKDKKDV